MTPDEFSDWCSYYIAQPFDDLHRYHRPAALISASMGSGDMQEVIENRINWLQPKASQENQYSDVDMSFMKAMHVKPPKG